MKFRPKLVILLDAFGKEYFENSTYLKSLAKDNNISKIEPIFGYQCCDDSFFSGKYPSESGIWFNFILKKNKNILLHALAKIVGKVNKKCVTYGIPFLISKLKKETNLDKLPLNLPLNLVGKIKRPITQHPVNKKYPNETVFSSLRDKGIESKVFISNVVFDKNGYKIKYHKKHGDESVKEIFLKNLNNKTCFYLVHLTELDSLGHNLYLGSGVKFKIKKEELLIRDMISKFKQKFPDGDFIVFGDHGMSKVKNHVDSLNITEKIRSIDKDAEFFIESTFLRVYLGDKSRKKEVEKELKKFEGFYFLDENMSRKYKVPYDPVYGDIILCSNPHHVFYPDFYNESLPLGMHGFPPETKDTSGYIITNIKIKKGKMSIPEFAKLLKGDLK